MMLADALPALNDLACGAFLLWTLRSLVRVITGRNVTPRDPMKVMALLLLSGRYGFTFNRWAFGMHREAVVPGEELGRQGAFLWALATIAIAALVIRGYRKIV
jgi:hypothetical protein